MPFTQLGKKVLSAYRWSRRDLFRGSALAAASGLMPAAVASAAAAAPGMSFGADMYSSIGVRPVINCKGTFTILSGSLMLPECRQAMMQASQSFVHIDELMEGVGKRLAEITGAEAAIATNGCAAALAHATAACIAGADPERMQRLPDLTGLKNEVIAPNYSRNVYDHAIRMVGVKFINVENADQLRRATGPATAMIMVLASPEDTGPFGLKEIAEIAHAQGVPVLVDAAAEDLTIPNVHLQRGADLVAYSGGKALRGPQSSGLLMGRKDLIKAAWLNSAPHHALGRPMKIGKEETMGLLAAVEMWVRRDHAAEWKAWEGWLDEIAHSVTRVSGVRTEVRQPQGLSNRSPRLVVQWDGKQIGITGDEVFQRLYDGSPRIVLAGSSGNLRRGAEESSVSIMPWQMQPGDATVVAAELHKVLSKPPKREVPAAPAAPSVDINGQWDLHLSFVLGSADHGLVFEQKEGALAGTHVGERTGGDLRGWVEGDRVQFRSSHPWQGTRLGYDFAGRVSGDSMEGEVDLGEYGKAAWSAKRHTYGQPGGLVRPVKNV